MNHSQIALHHSYWLGIRQCCGPVIVEFCIGNASVTNLSYGDDATVLGELLKALVLALETLFGGLLDEGVECVHACGKDVENLEGKS